MSSECPTCLSSDLAWLLSQAHYTLANEVTAAIEPLGISMREFQVLKTAVQGSYTQKDLADLVGLDKTTMVATIDDLEQAGLAVRRPSETDRRARVISVTAAGKRKITQGREMVERVQQNILKSLPAAQREGFLEGLGQLVRDRFSTMQVECKRPVRRRRAA